MSAKNYNFVVIDDNPNTAVILNFLLQGSGLEGEIIYFQNPKEALIFFDEHSCDLLFLDVEMPEMTGFEFLNQVKNPPFTIILTSYPIKYAERAFQFLDKKLIDFVSKDQLIPLFPRIKDRFLEKFSDKYIYAKSNLNGDSITKISLGTIKYFSKSRNKINLVVGNETKDHYYIEGSFEDIENILPKNSYYRIRKSKIIMISHMKCYISGKINMGVDSLGNEIFIEVPHRERKLFIDYFNKRNSMVFIKE